MVIKMADPIKQNQNIYNHFTSIKVDKILIVEDNSYTRVIKQDIIVETRESSL